MKENKKRNLEYEKKFRSYLFSMGFETHKKICVNINVKPNITEENKIYQALIILKPSGKIKKFIWTDEKKYLISCKALKKAEIENKISIISIGFETNNNIDHYLN